MMAAAVAAMTLGELLGPAAGSYAALAVTDLVLDSRQVQQGAAFVAVRGTARHGLGFADEALRQGAAVVLYEAGGHGADDAVGAVNGPALAVERLGDRIGDLAHRFFWRGRSQPDLYGVTGTNGKTTVAWLVAQTLRSLDRDCSYVGTLGYGRPGALQPHALTTPDCFTLHRELAGLGAPSAMLEVSSHGLAQDRVAGLEFAVAAVTNLSRDHLDAHGSMSEYAKAKSRIVHLPGLRTAVLNLDDDFAAGLRADVPANLRVIGVSAHARAELTADVSAHGFDGLTLDVSFEGSHAQFRSPLIGRFNADNLLVALGIVLATGQGLPEACTALGESGPAPGRMEVFGGGTLPWVVVDYAHSPAALEHTLAVLDGLRAGSLTCVFGCGGDRDPGKRVLMGQAALAADRIVLTDDNPRTEDPAAIVEDIRRGIPADRQLDIDHDRERAIAAAIATATRGDVVLIAGKGHETTQLIAGGVRRLDDRQLVRDALGSPS